MQKSTAKKLGLHGAAAESHRQAAVGRGQPKAATAKPAETERKPSKASSETKGQTRSR